MTKSIRNYPRWTSYLIITGAHDAILLIATLMSPGVHPTLSYLIQNEQWYQSAHFWFQWDVLWYQHIAFAGYTPLSTAFFPWVPLTIHLIPNLWFWLAVMQFVFLGVLWAMDNIMKTLDMSQSERTWALWFFSLNPAAIYFTTLYPEPWTLFWGLMSWAAFLRGKRGTAFAMALMASLTHGTAILWGIFPLVSAMFALNSRKWLRFFDSVLWGSGFAVGFLSYMAYCWIKFADPLIFLTVEHTKWNNHWAWPWHQWVVVLTRIPVNLITVILMIAGIIMVVGLVGLINPVCARFSVSWMAIAIYGTVVAVVALAFDRTSLPLHSTIRLLSGDFPIYLGWAHVKSRSLKLLVLFIFLIYAGVGAYGFSHGFFYQ
ncbi:MAG: hypothetical protein M1596_04315 [Firmicutes bacterium]|nr:hypothetical protein [Bacillota bacterium]